MNDLLEFLKPKQCRPLCAFCGVEFEPVPVTGAAAMMIEHIKVCEKHPLAAMTSELERLRSENEALRSQVAATSGAHFGPHCPSCDNAAVEVQWVCEECGHRWAPRMHEAQDIEAWHEDIGPVVWWKFPVDEPAWIGTPLDSDWPGIHTHWTPHPVCPLATPRGE